MTDQEFQKAVLKMLGTLQEDVSTLKVKVSSLENKASSLESINEEIVAAIGEQKEFNEKFMTFIKDQHSFNEKLFIVVENEIVDKLSGFTDGARAYTDKTVEEHEEHYQHIPAVN